MLRKRINILTATSLLLLALSACGNAGASGDFSNGLVEVQFDLDEGTFDIVARFFRQNKNRSFLVGGLDRVFEDKIRDHRNPLNIPPHCNKAMSEGRDP